MNNIRHLREKSGLSQAEMAQRLNTSQPTIKRLENGDVALTLDWMMRIAEIFDVGISDIAGIEDSARISILGDVPGGPWGDLSLHERQTPLNKKDPKEWQDYVLYDGPLSASKLFALQVKGNSMNREVLDGYFVIFRNIEGEALTHASLDGKVVLVCDSVTNTCTLKRYNHVAQTFDPDSTDPGFRPEPTRPGQRIVAVAVEYKKNA